MPRTTLPTNSSRQREGPVTARTTPRTPSNLESRKPVRLKMRPAKSGKKARNTPKTPLKPENRRPAELATL